MKRPSRYTKDELLKLLIDGEINLIESRSKSGRDYLPKEMISFLETIKLNIDVLKPRKGKGGPQKDSEYERGLYLSVLTHEKKPNYERYEEDCRKHGIKEVYTYESFRKIRRRLLKDLGRD